MSRTLLILGVACLARATTLPVDPITDPDAAVFYQLWPMWVRAAIWVGAGLLALAGAWRPEMRAIGYAAVMAALVQRAAGHLWSWAMWLIPGAPGGDPWAITWAVWWGSLAALVAYLSAREGYGAR